MLNEYNNHYNKFTNQMNRFKKPQQSDEQLEQGQQVSQHSQSSEFIKTKSAGRINLCQICNNILAKYTCPKCDLKTCSINCIRIHKDVKNCIGVKQPTQYVPKQAIDQKIVEKDYNFIQDMISSADKIKKCLTGVNQTVSLQPRRFKILRNNAKQMYNIKVVNGPNVLERHRENISFFYVKNKSIFWVWELLYVESIDSESEKIKNCIKTNAVITQPISDQKTFRQILPQDYLNKNLLQEYQINTTKKEDFCVFLENKQRLNENRVQNSGKNIIFDIELIKKSKQTSQNEGDKIGTFFQLIEYDINRQINQQLHDISIFEFPTLYVVHRSMKDLFLKAYKSIKQGSISSKNINKMQGDRDLKKAKLKERGRNRSRSRDKQSRIRKNQSNQ